ncbi:viral A-type inclusion protein [Histomonas meleagridis]|uniref:viral A-type inclusion protein n=1 Tax=Histomonas meleagridis TaxID=135588 RepID=UPI00355A7758|nr:viral A-type inclusion protein [Histomonas meleagridis]KAH0797700.1 viral A-type inclusion protein [Histomonas meleagridis]
MNKQTNDLLHEANEKIYSLEDELTKSNSNIDVLEEKLSEQNQKMSNLINEQNNELKKKDEEIQELTIKNEQLIKAINEEEDKNTKASLEIQNYEQFKNQLETILPIKTENNEEMIQCIESLVDDSNNLSSISNYLKIPSKSEILDTVKVLNENIEFINNAVQESSKETIEDFVNDSLKKKQEEKEIAQLMNIDTIDSLPKIIDDLLKEKTESQRKLTEASQFTSKIFGIISSSPQTNLRFPLPTNIQQTVIDIVTSLQRNSAKNQEDVENVLQQAKSLGYEGSDCIEACDFMTNEIMESKKRLDKINDLKKEISEIKKEKDKSDSETLNLKNKIKDMKKIVVHQQIEAAKREEEINESLMEYEQKIKDLNEDLITERRIREQLSRIGAGFSADSQFLRSKLSENEVRLVEFVEKMMNQEKQTSLIHERQRKTREKLFGSTST